MPKTHSVKHEFVERFPKVLDEGVLYVSLTYGSAAHLCCCGCGHKVSTPIAPGRWLILFNGESISLFPSIGNWSFPCRSHYWIEDGAVVWDHQWSDAEIKELRHEERASLRDVYGPETPLVEEGEEARGPSSISLLLRRWYRRALDEE